MDLRGSILSDRIAEWVFRRAGKGCFLVGGRIRDLLTGRESDDLDFAVLRDAGKIASLASERFDGTFIEIHPPDSYRVALTSSRFLDFSNIIRDIRYDLRRRDFTINSLAWSPGTGLLCDPVCLDDINNGLIRTLSETNIIDDPLRILRAYRLAAQLDFNIESDTREILRQHTKDLIKSAGERITDEVFKMLSSVNAVKSVRLAALDNVLDHVIKVSGKDMAAVVNSIRKADDVMNKLADSSIYRHYFRGMDEYIGQNLTYRGFVRLFALVINPSAQGRLVMSSRIKRAIRRQSIVSNLASGMLSKSRFFEICEASGPDIYLSLINILLKRKGMYPRYLDLALEYLRISEKDLIPGREILSMIGEENRYMTNIIKSEIRRRRFLGKIRNKGEAKNWIISNLT